VSPSAASHAIDLLDVNVWLALAHPAHTHHKAAKTYWSETQVQLAFCRTSMQGFLRRVTQSSVMGAAVHTPREAWSIYEAHMSGGRTVFLNEPATLEDQVRSYTTRPTFNLKDWKDAWLASFAVTAMCRLVSFDGGFTQYDGLDFLHLKI
jgi:toxin-antitoxin system PIN domain toxin